MSSDGYKTVETPRNIIVFGSSQTGKTSLCNLLTGEGHITGNGVVGVPAFHLDVYRELIISHTPFRLVDTCGLNEPEYGASVNPEDALIKLLDMMDAFPDGLGLVIMVKPVGTVSPVEQSNYAIMNAIFPRIPKALVLSKADTCNDNWLQKNKDYYTKNHEEFKFNDVTYSINPYFEDDKDLNEAFAMKRSLTKERILKFIFENSIHNTTPYGVEGFFGNFVNGWNAFAIGLGRVDWIFNEDFESLTASFERMGISVPGIKKIYRKMYSTLNGYATRIGMSLGDVGSNIVEIFDDHIGDPLVKRIIRELLAKCVEKDETKDA